MVPIHTPLTLALIFLAIWLKYFQHIITHFGSVIPLESVRCHYEFKNTDKELVVFITVSLSICFWYLRLEVPQIHSELSRLLLLMLTHRLFISWLTGDLTRYFWNKNTETGAVWCYSDSVRRLKQIVWDEYRIFWAESLGGCHKI